MYILHDCIAHTHTYMYTHTRTHTHTHTHTHTQTHTQVVEENSKYAIAELRKRGLPLHRIAVVRDRTS